MFDVCDVVDFRLPLSKRAVRQKHFEYDIKVIDDIIDISKCRFLLIARAAAASDEPPLRLSPIWNFPEDLEL